MPDPKKVYEYEPICTVDYDGLFCDCDCLRCNSVASERAAARAEDRRDDMRTVWP